MPKVAGRKMSTQAGFGDILAEIGRGQGELKPLAEHIVTTSPDVTVSTNLGPWVNRRGVFDRHTRNDVFRDAKLASRAALGHEPEGPAHRAGHRRAEPVPAAGRRRPGATRMTGARLLPIGTVYDPFVNRGLDALIYACYQDARFLLVSTPSGLTLAPEGGQHQSINTPLIGMAADRLASFEPAHVDELAILLRHAFDHMQRPDGSAVWLRLSTRQLDAAGADGRSGAGDRRRALGGAAARRARGIALAYQGPVAPEAEAAFAELATEEPGAGLLAITSPDRLHAGWLAALRARRGGDRARHCAYRAPAGAARPGRGAGHGAGRASRARIPGWAGCAGSGSCRSGRTVSARAATFRTCTGNTASTPTPSWTPAPRRCSRFTDRGLSRGGALHGFVSGRPQNGPATQRVIQCGPQPQGGGERVTTARENMAKSNLNELLLSFLQDIYYAERQILKALPKMAKASQNEQLKQALMQHREETQGQVERLQKAFDALGKRARGQTCEAINGIIEEGEEIIDQFEQGSVRDAGIVASAQAVEHYEMARYGSLIAWARSPDRTKLRPCWRRRWRKRSTRILC